MNYYFAVFKKYAVFKGRASRKEFWMFALFSFIISLILNIITFVVTNNNHLYINLVTGIYSLITLVPNIAVGVRRIHDSGKNGWFVILPFYNIILLFIKGDKDNNKYGPNPSIS